MGAKASIRFVFVLLVKTDGQYKSIVHSQRIVMSTGELNGSDDNRIHCE